MRTKRSWQEKLHDSKDLPRIVAISGKRTRHWGQGTFIIPAPLQVDALMRQVPPGKLTTIDHLRRTLAQRHGATFACPITTGIFAWIAAHAADEREKAGKKRITPYWRTLKTNGELNPKYPDGLKNIAARLRAEGHKIIRKGSRRLVANFERALAPLKG